MHCRKGFWENYLNLILFILFFGQNCEYHMQGEENVINKISMENKNRRLIRRMKILLQLATGTAHLLACQPARLY